MKLNWKTKGTKMVSEVKIGSDSVWRAVHECLEHTGMGSFKFYYYVCDGQYRRKYPTFTTLEEAIKHAESTIDKDVAKAQKRHERTLRLQAAEKARKDRDQAVIQRLLANGVKSSRKGDAEVAKRIATLIARAN